MCGIFGGYNIPLDDVKKGINLIKRGNSLKLYCAFNSDGAINIGGMGGVNFSY